MNHGANHGRIHHASPARASPRRSSRRKKIDTHSAVFIGGLHAATCVSSNCTVESRDRGTHVAAVKRLGAVGSVYRYAKSFLLRFATMAPRGAVDMTPQQRYIAFFLPSHQRPRTLIVSVFDQENVTCARSQVRWLLCGTCMLSSASCMHAHHACVHHGVTPRCLAKLTDQVIGVVSA